MEVHDAPDIDSDLLEPADRFTTAFEMSSKYSPLKGPERGWRTHLRKYKGFGRHDREHFHVRILRPVHEVERTDIAAADDKRSLQNYLKAMGGEVIGSSRIELFKHGEMG